MSEDIVSRLNSSYVMLGDPLHKEAAEVIDRILEEIQQLKHDSTIFINERSDAICENFDLREENAELRDEIEKMRERRDDWRAAMTENHDLWNENERLRAALVKIMQKCPYARKDQWCACIDCNCIIARAALGEKTDAQNHVS